MGKLVDWFRVTGFLLLTAVLLWLGLLDDGIERGAVLRVAEPVKGIAQKFTLLSR